MVKSGRGRTPNTASAALITVLLQSSQVPGFQETITELPDITHLCLTFWFLSGQNVLEHTLKTLY